MRLRKVHQVRIYIITKHNIYLFETDSAHSCAQDNVETQLPTKYVKHNLKSSKERFSSDALSLFIFIRIAPCFICNIYIMMLFN